VVPVPSFLSVYLISRLGGMLSRKGRSDEAKQGVAETVTLSANFKTNKCLFPRPSLLFQFSMGVKVPMDVNRLLS